MKKGAETPGAADPTPPARVLVTGATSGIGLAICQRLLRDGHAVVGIGRDFEKTGDAFGEDAPRFEAVQLDLADLDALPGRLRELARRESDLNAVVLCAGRGEFGHLEEFSYEQIRALIDLDLTSQIFVARAFLPALKRRGSGRLIFMGSEAALRGRRQGALYCAAKFALRGLAQALREECAKSGVGVTILQPGMVETPFFDGLHFAPGDEPEHALRAEEIADAVAFVLAQRPGMVLDELVLSPLKHVVQSKPARSKADRRS